MRRLRLPTDGGFLFAGQPVLTLSASPERQSESLATFRLIEWVVSATTSRGAVTHIAALHTFSPTRCGGLPKLKTC